MKSIIYNILLLWIVVLVSTITIQAQGKLERANRYQKSLDYQNAIKAYEKVLKKAVVPDALFKLPECYRKIGNYKKAGYWYAQAVMHPEATPEMHLYLGICQLAQENVVDARASFNQFIALAPGDLRGKQLLAACDDSIRTLLQGSGALYVVRNIEEINTRYDEFSVAHHRKGLVYCAERDTAGGAARYTSGWTGRSFTDVYYIDARLVDEEKMEFKYGKQRPFDKIVKTKFHDGPVCFSPDGTIMYFTKNFYNKGKYNPDMSGILQTAIMKVKVTNTGWEKKAELVDFANSEYSVCHPAVTPQGDKMYFASDMPGGFGRMDIYVSYYEGGRWSQPINVGPEINTEGDELFPWVSPTGVLYFSSDGHTGLGGHDIYFTKATRGKWSPLENIGAPINSNYDDFGYSTDSSAVFGYFSSNREGGKGFTDIYSFTKLAVNAELLVFDKLTGKGIENVTLNSDCFPRSTFETNIEGRADLQLPLDRSCTFTLSSPDFPDTTVVVSTENFKIGDRLFFDVPILLRQIDMKVSGRLVDEASGTPLSNAKVEVLSNCGSAPQTTTTDADGNYSIKVKGDCQYVVKVVKEGYFTTTTNFNTNGIRKDTTIEGNIAMPEFYTIEDLDTSSLYQINAVYYDYDQDRINLDRSPDLQRLVDLMLNNEDLAVEIRSHTDSRGDAFYNQDLSMRRAQAITNFMIDNGISEARVSYKGFGETKLLNNCDDFTPCSEDQHRMNRRTEFRVVRIKKN